MFTESGQWSSRFSEHGRQAFAVLPDFCAVLSVHFQSEFGFTHLRAIEGLGLALETSREQDSERPAVVVVQLSGGAADTLPAALRSASLS